MYVTAVLAVFATRVVHDELSRLLSILYPDTVPPLSTDGGPQSSWILFPTSAVAVSVLGASGYPNVFALAVLLTVLVPLMFTVDTR